MFPPPASRLAEVSRVERCPDLQAAQRFEEAGRELRDVLQRPRAKRGRRRSTVQARERLPQADARAEARRGAEAVAVESAGVFQEIHRTGGRVVQPESEEPGEQEARQRLGNRPWNAADLLDCDTQRNGAGARDVEDAVRIWL